MAQMTLQNVTAGSIISGGSNQNSNAVTVLTATREKAVKTYLLGEDGQVLSIPYSNEKFFDCKVVSVNGIHELAEQVRLRSRFDNKIIIRGQPKVQARRAVERNSETYQEPLEGLSWVMLDFDNIPLPVGFEPTSITAIEYVIAKLPQPFHKATYFYQFSSSTGILKTDGTPLKAGLNVHLFFWLSQPATGILFKAYIKGHCLETDFFERALNKDGMPILRYGVDLSLFSAVQPHYIAPPIICKGVICTLAEEQRQGLVQKQQESVDLPVLDSALQYSVEIEHRRVLDAHKRAHGWVKDKGITKSATGGIAVHTFFRNPNPSAVCLGRMFIEARVTERQDRQGRPIFFATLFFEGEGSPGSWYVSSRQPCIARRFGDGEEVSLKEMSEGAYAYVRDDLGWFSDIQRQTLALDANGYLPPFSDFVTARNSLLLAPTGSGKTTAFCEFAKAHSGSIIIYAAQTIALTRQMEEDLRANQIRMIHYQDFSWFDAQHPGVFVTTNESLGKIVKAVRAFGLDFYLVIDEVHAALDDFMRRNAKNELLENTISRAYRSIFMTATLTPLQLKKLTETISHATGELTPANFGYYEFAPAKCNELWWAGLQRFKGDFVALLRQYQGLKEHGEAIPRTVIIAPTSKMRLFEMLLEAHELLEEADIVSRDEATQEDIEAARTSDKAILISSPLFALGLNFQCAPVRFWTYFENLDVDTSQIIQTLNRANRTQDACEVRLYAGALDPRPYGLPPAIGERMKVEG